MHHNFPPDGHVFQVGYANKAVEATVVVLQCKDGVAFAVENIITSGLYELDLSKRIYNVDKHIEMVCLENFILVFNRSSCDVYACLYIIWFCKTIWLFYSLSSL